MRHRRGVIYLAIAAAALVLALVGCNAYLRYQGWAARTVEPDALSDLLSPAYRAHFPEGSSPVPTALLFSGCDGPKDNMDRWAEALNARGWGAIIVDSHGPRGYDEAQLWRLICAGQLLTGGERAGDVAVAVEDARAMPQVDPERVLLLGASHGGWSILDMLSLHGLGRRPYNLKRWPASIAQNGLEGVAGVVLLYPYCGIGSQVSRHGWGADIPALFLLVRDDTIVDEESCSDVAARMTKQGMDVEVLMLEGTTHGFDQAEKNALSFLEFSPEAITEAQLAIGVFLDRISRN